MGWESKALFAAAIILIGYSTMASGGDTTTLLLILEKPLGDNEMENQIRVIESRLKYLGFKVEDRTLLRSIIIRLSIRGKDFGEFDELVLSHKELEVWVNDIYVFGGEDITYVGDVSKNPEGIWEVPVSVTDKAAERFSDAVRFYEGRKVIYNYIIVDGATAKLTIEEDLRRFAEDGYLDSFIIPVRRSISPECNSSNGEIRTTSSWNRGGNRVIMGAGYRDTF
jgi:hypothetical protein